MLHIIRGLVPFFLGLCVLTLLTAVSTFPSLRGGVTTVLRGDLMLYANLGVATGVAMVVALLVWPLWSLHIHMVSVCSRFARAHAAHLKLAAAGHEAALGHADQGVIKNARECYVTLRDNDAQGLGYVAWPIDVRLVRRLSGAVAVALSGPLATVVKELVRVE